MSEEDARLISGGYWDEAEDFPVSDWQYEVACDYTRRGYHDWVESQREQKRDDEKVEARQVSQ